MKYLITAAALLACGPAHAASTTPHSCDLKIWETREMAQVCANRAGNAAAVAAGQFRREVARAYRADPIGAQIAAATSVRTIKSTPKPKPVVAAAVTKTAKPTKPTRVAVAFSSKFMASLKEKK